jgi:hypothetical protein
VEEKYFLATYNVQTSIYTSIGENWIELRLRHVVGLQEKKSNQQPFDLKDFESIRFKRLMIIFGLSIQYQTLQAKNLQIRICKTFLGDYLTLIRKLKFRNYRHMV